jgi:hypothetical protein
MLAKSVAFAALVGSAAAYVPTLVCSKSSIDLIEAV